MADYGILRPLPPVQVPDIAGEFQKGMETGRQNAARRLLGPAMKGDQDAMDKLGDLSPDAYMKISEWRRSASDQQRKQAQAGAEYMSRVSSLIKGVSREHKAEAFAASVAGAQQMGMDVSGIPQLTDPDQIDRYVAMTNLAFKKATEPFTLSPGQARYGVDGALIATSPNEMTPSESETHRHNLITEGQAAQKEDPFGLSTQPGRSPQASAPAVTPNVVAQLERSDAAAKAQGVPVNQVTSPKGAVGEHQIMPQTAAGVGVQPGELTDPAKNREAAQKIIDQLNARYNNDPEAVAIAYNAGPAVADKWLQSGRNDSVLPRETQGYVSRLREISGAPAPSPGPTAPNPSAPVSPGASSNPNASINDLIQSGMHGPQLMDAISQRSPRAASYIQAMIEGRTPAATGTALKDPQTRQLISIATLIDPGFDETVWNARNKQRADLDTSGTAGKAVSSAQMVLHHGMNVLRGIRNLDNAALPMVNRAQNVGAAEFGDIHTADKTQRLKLDIHAYADELMKVFRNTGSGNVQEVTQWQQNFPLNGSKREQIAALREGVSLMEARLKTTADQWNRVMGPKHQIDPLSLLSEDSRNALITIMKYPIRTSNGDDWWADHGYDPDKIYAPFESQHKLSLRLTPFVKEKDLNALGTTGAGKTAPDYSNLWLHSDPSVGMGGGATPSDPQSSE